MPDQFVVPQFIDVEPKIIGPITARQFIVMLAVLIIEAVMYRLLRFSFFLGFGIPFLAFGFILAFVKINGQPFHFFILNLFQTLRKPSLRVWNKVRSNSELHMYMQPEQAVPAPELPKKPMVSSSRLQDLSMTVNTGGVYHPEENF
ncbi:MAG: hypothetical protein ACD_76C00145G0005 [uncultured bacterium]|nr:MAG: hypothetical protein ACD_76C00145G0005 [uncultured bacterium]HBD05378.1 hypothetical protein [Candidatus Uhrbacteria bacterium]